MDWACARLEGRAEGRRLLVVVSDGSPMDGATHLANDAHYLDHHLREVAARREQDGGVEIYGVGVGLDLSACYRCSQVVDLSTGVRDEVLRGIVAMLARR